MFSFNGHVREHVVAICKIYELYFIVGFGFSGRWLFFGAPIMHGMSSLNFAINCHGMLWHVHGRIQYGMVILRGWLLMDLTLASVKNLVNLLACKGCIRRCTSLLWWDILGLLICWLVQWDRRCGHVSLALLRHSEQLGFVCVKGQNMFFLVVSLVLCVSKSKCSDDLGVSDIVSRTSS